MSNEFSGPSTELRQRLRGALTVAMKARDRTTVTALRSALSAIDNAEAVTDEGPAAGAIEASAAGTGSTDVPRRVLTESDIAAVLDAEIAERETALGQYEQAGAEAHASALRREIAVLQSVLEK